MSKLDNKLKEMKSEILKLHKTLLDAFPKTKILLKDEEIDIFNFPKEKLRTTISHRIQIKASTKEFKDFKSQTENILTGAFPDIRFYWKSNQVYIYLEEYSSGIYITKSVDFEGFSVKMFEILTVINKIFQ